MKKFNISILLLFISLFSYSQSLDEYFEIAAQNNPGLQAKYLNFEAAMQKVSQLSSLPDPSLSFGYFISPVETRVGPQLAKFSLTQMFPWFGTLNAQESAATFMAESMYKAFLNARNSLYYQVSAAYYPLYELNRLRKIEAENIAILSAYKDIATMHFQNGNESLVNVLRADMMLKDATTNLSILMHQERPLVSNLNSLLNRIEDDTIIIADTLLLSPIPFNYRRDSILVLNPLLDELDLKIKASESNERAAVKQGLPKLGVGLDYVIVGERSDVEMPNNGKDAFAAMVSVSIPIFRSKYKAMQKEAHIMQESFSLQKEDLSNRLVSSYDMAWFESQKQAEYVYLYDYQIEESKQSLNLLFTSYTNSGEDFEEVLRMEQQLLKYQKLRVTAIVKYHIELAELDYISAKSR